MHFAIIIRITKDIKTQSRPIPKKPLKTDTVKNYKRQMILHFIMAYTIVAIIQFCFSTFPFVNICKQNDDLMMYVKIQISLQS